jgi:phosphoribosyl 1,2-cyclic phosphodiesterase
MELEFWGVRGTAPAPGAAWVRYGGHTTCSSVRVGPGQYIVVDAGTGLRELGDRIMAEEGGGDIRIDLLLTHFHLDHIMGFPVFAPLYSPRTSLVVHAPAGAGLPSPGPSGFANNARGGSKTGARETESALAGLMAYPYFPLGLGRTSARKEFREFTPGPLAGGIAVSACPLRHPQGSVAYRLDAGRTSVVLATDTEHPEAGIDERLAAFARGAEYLVYDAMFTPAEYEAGRKGWGHSTWLAGTSLAAGAEVGHLVLSHFNPAHTDEAVDLILGEARERLPATLAAAQGLKLGKE